MLRPCGDICAAGGDARLPQRTICYTGDEDTLWSVSVSVIMDRVLRRQCGAIAGAEPRKFETASMLSAVRCRINHIDSIFSCGAGRRIVGKSGSTAAWCSILNL